MKKAVSSRKSGTQNGMCFSEKRYGRAYAQPADTGVTHTSKWNSTKRGVMFVGSAATMVREDEGFTIHAFGDGRVLFVRTDDNAIKSAVIFGTAVVGTRRDGAGNAAVRFLRFHIDLLLSDKNSSKTVFTAVGKDDFSCIVARVEKLMRALRKKYGKAQSWLPHTVFRWKRRIR